MIVKPQKEKKKLIHVYIFVSKIPLVYHLNSGGGVGGE